MQQKKGSKSNLLVARFIINRTGNTFNLIKWALGLWCSCSQGLGAPLSCALYMCPALSLQVFLRTAFFYSVQSGLWISSYDLDKKLKCMQCSYVNEMFFLLDMKQNWKLAKIWLSSILGTKVYQNRKKALHNHFVPRRCFVVPSQHWNGSATSKPAKWLSKDYDHIVRQIPILVCIIKKKPNKTAKTSPRSLPPPKNPLLIC